MIPVDCAELYQWLVYYYENPQDEELEELVITEFLYPVARNAAFSMLSELEDYESAVQVGVVSCLNKIRPPHLRPLAAKGARKGQPIRGFEPNIHKKPYNLLMKYAECAMRDENRKERRRSGVWRVSVFELNNAYNKKIRRKTVTGEMR